MLIFGHKIEIIYYFAHQSTSFWEVFSKVQTRWILYFGNNYQWWFKKFKTSPKRELFQIHCIISMCTSPPPPPPLMPTMQDTLFEFWLDLNKMLNIHSTFMLNFSTQHYFLGIHQLRLKHIYTWHHNTIFIWTRVILTLTMQCKLLYNLSLPLHGQCILI